VIRVAAGHINDQGDVMPAVGRRGTGGRDAIGSGHREHDLLWIRQPQVEQRPALAVGNRKQRLRLVGRGGLRRAKPEVDREAPFAGDHARKIGVALGVARAIDDEAAAKPAGGILHRGLADELGQFATAAPRRLPARGWQRAFFLFEEIVEASLFEHVGRCLVAVGSGDEFPEDDGADIGPRGLDPRLAVRRHGLRRGEFKVLRRGERGGTDGDANRDHQSMRATRWHRDSFLQKMLAQRKSARPQVAARS
jgi:hypothetical protein